MSYSFKVRFSGGQGEVTEVSGTPPESGYIAVNGHSDPVNTNIGAALVGEDGAQLVGGYGTARTVTP